MPICENKREEVLFNHIYTKTNKQMSKQKCMTNKAIILKGFFAMAITANTLFSSKGHFVLMTHKQAE